MSPAKLFYGQKPPCAIYVSQLLDFELYVKQNIAAAAAPRFVSG
jgi:hypothetical protein